MDILEKLCNLNGLSGDEDEVREYILKCIQGYCSGQVDCAGNIIAFKKGVNRSQKKVLFEAHMDETGYMVKRINPDGLLSVESVGVSAGVSVGKTVLVHGTANGVKLIPGVIGAKPIHLLDKSQTGIAPKMSELYIDIGAKNERRAREIVIEGDSVYFDGQFGAFGRYCKGKALDDRAGCYDLIRLIRSELMQDASFAFCVQEEVGLRGAAIAAQSVNPDLVVVLEGTTAADIAGVDASETVCRVGQGVAISFADRGTVYDPELVARITALARQNGIAYQIKTFVSGGNDAASWQRACAGCKVITLSVPVRYLHSRISVAARSDIDSMFELAYLINREADRL